MWQRSSIANTFTLIKTIPKIHFTIPSHYVHVKGILHFPSLDGAVFRDPIPSSLERRSRAPSTGRQISGPALRAWLPPAGGPVLYTIEDLSVYTECPCPCAPLGSGHSSLMPVH